MVNMVDRVVIDEIFLVVLGVIVEVLFLFFCNFWVKYFLLVGLVNWFLCCIIVILVVLLVLFCMFEYGMFCCMFIFCRYVLEFEF